MSGMLCEVLVLKSAWGVLQMNGDPQRIEEQPYGIPDKKVPERWDVVGLGQAMVGVSVTLYVLISWWL